MEPTASTAPSEMEVPAAHAGRRLDKFLRAQFKGVPAGLIFRHLRKGGIRVNGRKADGGYRIQEGDVLTLPAFEVQDTAPKQPPPKALVQRLNRAIVYEDEQLLIVDKPAGVPVHVGTGHRGGVIEALRADRPHEPDLDLAHRLDRETSGLLILTKTPAMLRYLSELFAQGDAVRRDYVALVRGAWPERLTELTDPIARTPRGVIVAADGDPALTRTRVRRRFGDVATLLDVELITGRKHQIRVHTSHAGHPIAGDDKYGDAAFTSRVGGSGLFLHATGLSFPLPDGETLTVTSPTPDSWQRIFDRLAGRPPAGNRRGGQRRRGGRRPGRRG